ncbi:MAG: hypothetical protein MUE53_00225 [Chitinophagales bacterium]|jgi:cytochrome c peroxidase|nr:hypothetical protein [Chitinophagales bacterium]
MIKKQLKRPLIICSTLFLLINSCNSKKDLSSKDAQISLGKFIFEDKRLSSDGKISCASCHIDKFAFADTLPLSKGVDGQFTNRNSLSLVNVGFYSHFMYDSAASDLALQALIPIHKSNEMNFNIYAYEKLLTLDDFAQDLSHKAYKKPITAALIGQSLKSYLSSLVHFHSKYDLFVSRNDTSLFSKSEQFGYFLFFGKGQCASCHRPPLFTDQKHYNTGFDTFDIGLYAHTLDARDKFRFRTPSLRNLSVTAPYGHNGAYPSLKDFLTVHLNIQNHPHDMPSINLLIQEQSAILDFLKTLDDSCYMQH